jgi:hypothetical protein
MKTNAWALGVLGLILLPLLLACSCRPGSAPPSHPFLPPVQGHGGLDPNPHAVPVPLPPHIRTALWTGSTTVSSANAVGKVSLRA